MQLVVGRIGRPHGLKGEVTVEVLTDVPEWRYVPGLVLRTSPPERGPLRIDAVREQNGRLLVRFDEVSDRTAAESLRGVVLAVDSATSPPLDDPEEFWDHDLIGLRAVTVAGLDLGEVIAVVHPPGADLLAIRRPGGAEVLVPFVAAMVPKVDLSAGRVLLDPPAGLLEL